MLTKYLAEPDQRRLIDAAARSRDPIVQRDHAMLRALLHSGCRVNEFSLVNIGAALLALSARRLVIPREHRKGGRRDHVVLVTAPLAEALQDLLDARAAITGTPINSLAVGDALLVNRYGAPLGVRSIQKRVAFWAERAGLQQAVSPHWLRHCRGYNIMRRSGAADPRGVVQQALGHAGIGSTGIYTQAAEHEVLQALERVDARPAARKRDAVKQFRAQIGGAA